MTGGRVVVLGETGRNFAAGMSGGVAYVWDKKHNFDYFCNMDQVEINLVEEASARKELHELVRQHYLYTGSELARRMLDDWNHYIEDFVQQVQSLPAVCSTTGTTTSRTSFRLFLSSISVCFRKRSYASFSRR